MDWASQTTPFPPVCKVCNCVSSAVRRTWVSEEEAWSWQQWQRLAGADKTPFSAAAWIHVPSSHAAYMVLCPPPPPPRGRRGTWRAEIVKVSPSFDSALLPPIWPHSGVMALPSMQQLARVPSLPATHWQPLAVP